MSSPEEHPPSLVPEFFQKYAGGSHKLLVPYAADVVIMCRIGSLRRAADFFSAKFGHKISRKPIADIVKKVEDGRIVVTREELIAAAKSHPLSAKHLEKCPWIADPEGDKPIPQKSSAPQKHLPKQNAKLVPPPAVVSVSGGMSADVIAQRRGTFAKIKDKLES